MNRLIFLILVLFSIIAKAQEFKYRKNTDLDSLFDAAKHSMPSELREKFVSEYNSGDKETKEFLLLMALLPRSSKTELIKNYEDKSAEIENLKREYYKLVPKNYKVDIEFEPENKIFTISEKITIKIYKLSAKGFYKIVSQNWDLEPDSKDLQKVIKSIGWSNETLLKIKKLLEAANCISIKNGPNTTIGFSRSGFGKYSYIIFDKPLNTKEIEEYNNGCEYIFYKQNIVLEYGGGAVGPQCFEKD